MCFQATGRDLLGRSRLIGLSQLFPWLWSCSASFVESLFLPFEILVYCLLLSRSRFLYCLYRSFATRAVVILDGEVLLADMSTIDKGGG